MGSLIFIAAIPHGQALLLDGAMAEPEKRNEQGGCECVYDIYIPPSTAQESVE
jgi:hypothetical protein